MERLNDYSYNELMKITLDALPKYIYFENFSPKDADTTDWELAEIGYKGQAFECTKCGYKWTKEGRTVEHKGTAACPECQNAEFAYNRKLGRSSKKIHLNLVLCKLEDYNSVWAECVRVDAEDFTDIYSPNIYFQKRALYHFSPGSAVKYKFDIGQQRYRMMKSCNGYRFWVQQMTVYCHEEDYDILMSLDVLDNSFLKYSSLDKCPKDYLLGYMALCCKSPAFAEFCSKTEMWDAIKAKIDRSSIFNSHINMKANTFAELFPKFSKTSQKRLVRYVTSGNAPLSLNNFVGALAYLREGTPGEFDRIEGVWGVHTGRAAGIIAVTKGSPVTLYNYLEKQRKDSLLSSMLVIYQDYINECVTLGYNFTTSVLYPKDLREKHSETSKLCRYSASPVEIAKSKKRAEDLKSKGYNYRHKRLQAIIPADANEIIKEGAALDHCVGGYAKTHSNGNTTIIFIRRNTAPSVPFFTLEIDKDFKIKQCFGKKNRDNYRKNLEVGQFLEHYVKHLNYCKKKGCKTA